MMSLVYSVTNFFITHEVKSYKTNQKFMMHCFLVLEILKLV